MTQAVPFDADPAPAGEPVYYHQLSTDPDAAGDGRFAPTDHTEGAWSSAEQHMGPVSGLLFRALEERSGRLDLVTARVSYDIFGMIRRDVVEVRSEVIRPGRTIELVRAEMVDGDRTLVRATGWRLLGSDTGDLAGGELPELAGPDSAEPDEGASLWPGGYIRSVEIRVLPGARPGRAKVWLRARPQLVAGTEVGDPARMMALVDTANGIAVRVRPEELIFPNTDLSVHLFRTPSGEWLGLDTTVSFGPNGVGLTSSVLHDRSGPFGTAAQALTLRRSVRS